MHTPAVSRSIVAAALSMVIACTPSRPPVGPVGAPPPVAQPTLGATVLVVATGYGAERDAIARAELQRDYCAGAIAVHAPARAIADQVLGCANPTVVATLEDFLPRAKTGAIVTDVDHVTARWKALAVDGKHPFLDASTYPLVAGTPALASHLTHFILTGVTAITRGAGLQIDAKGIAWYTANLRPALAGADYVHISNEVSLKADCQYAGSGTYQFCSKERDFQALLDLHANVIELTGNHMRDFGDEPFRQTMAWYAAHAMHTFGGGLTPEAANTPIILPLKDGKRLGILGFNETCPLKECALKPDEVGTNAWDPDKAKAAIAALRARADYVLVTVQYKEVDSAQPTDAQTAIGHLLIDSGADLVYGSQAHQLQVVEFYRGKPIFHGLGNFMFDQIHRLGVRQAFFLHQFFYAGRLVAAVPVFTFMSDERQPTLATPAQAAEMRAIVFEDARLYGP